MVLCSSDTIAYALYKTYDAPACHDRQAITSEQNQLFDSIKGLFKIP